MLISFMYVFSHICVFIFLELMYHMITFYLTFRRTAKIFSKAIVQLSFLPAMYEAYIISYYCLFLISIGVPAGFPNNLQYSAFND